jgi:hypothetical protein
MALADDVLVKIRRDFGEAEALQVIERLEGLPCEDRQLFCDRILRCIVFVAAGRLALVEEAVALARLDYRDLIIWAEYDRQFETRHRDLSLPFPA